MDMKAGSRVVLQPERVLAQQRLIFLVQTVLVETEMKAQAMGAFRADVGKSGVRDGHAGHN
jgi:flagellar biosynthesis regulator FlbT